MAKRKRIARGTRPRLSLAEWQWLSGIEQPDANPFEMLMLRGVGMHREPDARRLDRARTIWAEYKREALRAWLEHSPGTRPEPWWHFDAPADTFRVVEETTDDDGVPVTVTESEAAFLDRHGLLYAAERRRLPADAFEPVGDDGPMAAELLARWQGQETVDD